MKRRGTYINTKILFKSPIGFFYQDFSSIEMLLISFSFFIHFHLFIYFYNFIFRALYVNLNLIHLFIS